MALDKLGLAFAFDAVNDNRTKQGMPLSFYGLNINRQKQGVAFRAYLANGTGFNGSIPFSSELLNDNRTRQSLPFIFTILDGSTVYVAAGDLAISWKTRNRAETGFNSLENTNVLDDPDFDQFRIEIYSETSTGSFLRNTITQAGKSYTYTTAQQTTDGGPFTTYRIRIRQESENYPGHWYQFFIKTV
jgi:hypothetical protein